MKIGDKVFCIKNRGVFNIKNKTYTILHIDESKDTIHIDLDNAEITLYRYCAFKLCLTDNLDHQNSYVFSDYFMPQKEQRKLKLKKIYENRG